MTRLPSRPPQLRRASPGRSASRSATPRSTKPKAARSRSGSATPLDGRCGARLRGDNAGRFCTDERVRGRTRCRIHGGASPRGAAHPRTKHGLYSKGAGSPEVFAAPFVDAEQRLIERWRGEPEEGIRQTLAEVLLVQRRALRVGAMEIYARLTTAAGTLSRAIISLHEVPPPERGLPKLVEFFEGRTPEDFAHDLEVIRREAQVSVR